MLSPTRRPPCALLTAVLIALLATGAAPLGHTLPVRGLSQDLHAKGPPNDKVLHGIAGASFALLGAALTSSLASDAQRDALAWTAAAVGLGSAALVGLAKELWDLSGAGDPELADFLCTLLGGAVAAAAAYGFLQSQAGSDDPARLSVPLAAFGVVLALPVANAACTAARRPPTAGTPGIARVP